VRALFVGQCHPATPHVCGVRLREFATALARRGHQVVTLTEPLDPTGPGDGADGIAARLAAHDWSTPFTVAAGRAPAPLLGRLHEGRLPAGLRQGVVATAFVFRGGVFADWRAGCREAGAALARTFRPEIAWGTFGVSDAWNVARDAAREAGCPWVADLKDNWDNFIPKGLRGWLARRYADAAHLTVLSEAHREIATRRFPVPATVVNSGFARPAADSPPPSDEDDGAFRILAAGSIYDGRAMAAIVAGIAAWLEGRQAAAPVEIDYCGGDHARMGALLEPLAGRCRTRARPFVPPARLSALEARASVIVYPRHPPMLYHHKFMESLASGRPIVCLPAESAECQAIAQRVGGALFSCDSAAEVAAALTAVEAGGRPALDRAALEAYSWDAQAVVLEGVFRSVVGKATAAAVPAGR